MDLFIKKFISSFLITVIVMFHVTSVFALDVSTAPTAPDQPSAPAAPPEAPQAPPAPSAPLAPSSDQNTSSESTAKNNDTDNNNAPTNQSGVTDNNLTPESAPVTQSNETTNNEVPQTTLNGVSSNGNVGSTAIITGDATNSVSSEINANTNIAIADASGGQKSNMQNSGNGTGSLNNSNLNISENNDTQQVNNAVIENSLEQQTITGQNSASQNVGDSFVKTGDANTSGTALTAVNTNIQGVGASEFNVADDHNGDIVLNFGGNSCIIGCSNNLPSATTNTGNGSDSVNNSSVNADISNQTFQTNDASVGSSLTLASDSGNNIANQNTQGDSTIKTGDANVTGNMLTFVNNNILGNVLIGVVNIFGTLVGDIILPESVFDSASSSQTQVANSENGSNSSNSSTVFSTTNDTTTQVNTADIENNLDLVSTTGENFANSNTGGDATVKTGTADVETKTVNVANSNIDGGNMWLVFVNNAGEWIGKILGSPDGSSFAGSDGTEFKISPTGEITASNSENGEGSQNNSNVSENINNSTTQTNNAKIVNNLNLSANTGGNNTDKNTGGDSTILTGDAKVIANLVNFVNNNIKSQGKLIVTFINIFGSWKGDFLAPGMTKPNNNTEKENTQNPEIISDSSSGNNTNNNAGSSSQEVTNDNVNQEDSSNQQPIINETAVKSFKPNNTVQTMVAGIRTDLNGAFDFPVILTSDKVKGLTPKIKINLAWLILIIPAAIFLSILGKKFKFISWITRRK